MQRACWETQVSIGSPTCDAMTLCSATAASLAHETDELLRF